MYSYSHHLTNETILVEEPVVESQLETIPIFLETSRPKLFPSRFYRTESVASPVIILTQFRIRQSLGSLMAGLCAAGLNPFQSELWLIWPLGPHDMLLDLFHFFYFIFFLWHIHLFSKTGNGHSLSPFFLFLFFSFFTHFHSEKKKKKKFQK